MLGAMGEFPVQVINPAPGGGSNIVELTTHRLLTLTATSVVYEPNSKLLYVAIPATSSSNPNTILPINPTTGGSTNNPNPPATTQKTSAGTYTVTVVATSGTVSHGTNVTLVVQ
jgi:hypothetical protein